MALPRAIRFFRDIRRDNRMRVEARRVLGGDLARYALNLALRPLELALLRSLQGDGHPICFIVGPPRSGTTLLHQLAAAHLPVGYVTNRMARYWLAPVWAARRFFPDDRGRQPFELASALGGTRGADAPHEFAWFWQHHLELVECDELPAGPEADRRLRPIVRELVGMAQELRRPIVLKNLTHVVLNINAISRALPEARFVRVRRDPRFTAQSLLLSRRQRYGDERVWWSVRPRGWQALRQRDPIEQVAWQLRTIERHVDAACRELGDRWLDLEYEDLVARPEAGLSRLAALVGVAPLPGASTLPELASGNVVRLDAERFAALTRAVEETDR